ncbi:MAG: S8 family serine peptidase [Bacteroidota bacterium]
MHITGRFSVFTLLFLFVLAGGPASSALAETDTDDDKKGRSSEANQYITPGWVVVKFNAGHTVTTGVSKTGIRSVDAIMSRISVLDVQPMFGFLNNLSASKQETLKGVDELQRIHKMQFDAERDPQMVAALLSRLPEVEYAEPLYRHKITRVNESPAWFESMPAQSPFAAAIPNDPRYNEQIYFDRFFIEDAWDVIKAEAGDVVVAVIDGGTDWTHEDMVANLWVNPGEIPDNGVDDDGNNFVDDVNGWNFPANSNDPKGLTNTPSNAQHGTATAGLVAAQSDNGTGIAGTSWNGTYLPVNIGCPNADDFICFTLDGIAYATVNGADIINASLGGSFGSSTGQDVVNFAYENGALLIAAAGNGNRNNNDFNPHFPANYNHVLSVGATSRSSDALTSFTNIGVSVDVFAPGSGILTTSPFNSYFNQSGTSFSAPITAGLAGMVKVLNPTWGPDEIREQVRSTSDDILGAGANGAVRNRIGKGRINALRAVTEAIPSVRIVNAELRDATGSSRIGPGEVASVLVDVTNFLEPVSNLTLTLETSATDVTLRQPTATIPTLNTGDTTQVVFEIQPSFTIDANVQANMVTQMSSGDYTDIDAFPVLLNSTTHDTGNIQVTLTDEGNIGYEGFAGETPGNGFRYLGFDFLFEGGLIVGSSVNTISDNIRGVNPQQDDDFVRATGTNFGIIDGRETAEEGALELVDTNAETPLNLNIRQDSYADTSAANRDFVIIKYTIENQGAASIDDFYAGLFFDWDSFDDPGSDHARYDASREMGYFLNNTPEMADVFLATKMLTDNDITFRAIDNTTEIYGNTGPTDPNDGFTDDEKWEFLSSGIQTQSLDVTDISIMLSGGPFTIGAGESIEVAFAVVGGTSTEEIGAHADAAQTLWDNTLAGLSPNPVSNEDDVLPVFTFGLADPYPNPARGEATIDFELPAVSEVQLSVYDLLGREVKTLAQSTMPAGKHSITWDGRDNAGLKLASGVYMINLTTPTADGPKSATRKVVLLK